MPYQDCLKNTIKFISGRDTTKYSNVKDKGGENVTLIFIKQCNFNVKIIVLIISLKPFHHACGHQASFSVGKMDDSIFSVNFFYIIFVYQKCPMATHKIAIQYTC